MACLAGMVFACGTAAMPLGRADQPQWGERFTRNMVSNETGLPEGFDVNTGTNVKWSARLGSETHATPVVAAGRVYIGTNNNVPRDPRHRGDRGVLMCFDEQSGALQWQLVVPKITTSRYWDWPNSGICSPVTVDEGRAYVVSNRGEILCLDPAGMANGNQGAFQEEARHQAPADQPPIEPAAGDADILWQYDLIGELGVRQHDSAHGSPLVYQQFLYVNTSNGVDDTHRHIASPDAPSLVVLDKLTGRLVATDDERIGPRIFHCTWSSPALAEVNGRPLVIFAGDDGVVYAFEPLAAAPPAGQVARLRKVWQFDCDPAAPKENVHRYIANRSESPSNIKGMPVVYNQRVYVTVGGDLWWGKRESWLKCIDAAQTGDITGKGEVWSYPLERHAMATPAIRDGLVFVGDTGRRIHCVDAETGRAYWTHDAKGEIWASPLVADGRVYFATRRGEVLVFAASREKRLLGECQLAGPISGSPVAANGVLFVSTMTHLYALHTGGK
jgi:outer membrane protein assembly factor BamB